MSSTTSESPAWLPRTCLSSSMTEAGSRVASSRTCSGTGPARRLGRRLARRLDLLGGRAERLGGLDDEARLLRVLVVDAATHEHDLVDAERALVLRQRLAEDEDLDAPLEVVEGREHHRVALLRADLLGLGDDAAGGDPVAVLALVQLRERGVDRGTQRLAHLLERVGGDEEADRLLLDGRAARPARTPRSGSAGRTARTSRPGAGGRRRRDRPRRRGRRCCPGRSGRRAAASARRPGPARARSSMPLRDAPVEPNAPHFTSASIAFLLTARGSTRAQKSHSDVNGPPLSRAALMASTA